MDDKEMETGPVIKFQQGSQRITIRAYRHGWHVYSTSGLSQNYTAQGNANNYRAQRAAFRDFLGRVRYVVWHQRVSAV